MKENSLFFMNNRFVQIIQDGESISHATNEHPALKCCCCFCIHTSQALWQQIETILWRNGPPEKPVLCNACGSRWRVRRTLDGYIPRHGYIEKESYQRPSDMKPARDERKLEVGVEVSGQDGSSACLEEEMNNISSLGSAGSSSDNCMQMEETNAYKDPLWNPDSVPRRKRSERRKHILSPVERLQRQLHNILQEPDFENISADDENILIYASNKYIPPNEIGLGAMLLVSPPTATVDNDASCSVNVPVGNSNSNLDGSLIIKEIGISTLDKVIWIFDKGEAVKDSGILRVSQEERDQSVENTFCHLLKDSRGNFILIYRSQTLKISVDDENILIYARNKYIPPNEIVLGAMLLVSPPTTTEHSMSLSPMAVAGRAFTEREAFSSQIVKLVKLSILVQARSVAFSQWCGKAAPDCFIECKIGIHRSSEATWMGHMSFKIMFTITKAAREHLFFGKSSWG
ncbi:hypothetical protein MTR67_006267 [Solanum verrucosum]|uniref:GATA-type domain-containing protein n=2 Tax=Solanum TaxID=4107 RepID=A0AAF0PXV0_SOLVR|nr:hypothetical protein MTR67_006267 [Solanum verrucosum]